MNDYRRTKQLLGLTSALLLLATAAQAGEGFGMLRKRANLARIHPPQVRIGGSRISVKTSSQGKKYSSAAERMESLLESELLGSDPTLRLDSNNADVAIDVNILQDDYSESWENRTEMRNVQTGNDEKGRPVFQARQMSVRYKVVKHLFSVSFKVLDSKKKDTLAADTIRKNFKEDFEEGNGAPDAAALEEANVVGVVNDLTRRLTPTKEIIGVLVPRGSLDNAVPFAEAGMWSKYLEAVEKIAAMPNPVNESYRQYAMGIAYEALGYGAEDLDTALKYLEQAATLYNSAAEANPKEQYFILNSKSQPSLFGRARTVVSNVLPGTLSQKVADEKAEISSTLLAPLARVQSALVQYQKMKELNEGVRPPPSKVASLSGAKGLDTIGGDSGEPPLTNDGIVEMLEAGVPESVIVTAISAAHRTAFDVSPKGLVALSQAKASTKLLERIQAEAAKKSGSKPSASTKKKTG